jgi:serine/threonine protein kinase
MAALSAEAVGYLKLGRPYSSLQRLQDRFRLSEATMVGQGKHSDVLLCTDLRSGRDVAIKLISLGHTKEHRARFEALAMTHLNHPHIVGLLDVLQCTEPVALARSEPNFLCIVMDYVEDAEKLSTLILRNGSDPVLAKRVVSQVGGALAHVHDQNLIHRDLWSENILVNSKTGHVTLIDFGCAEYICSDALPEDHVNRPYASPEMTRREKPNAGDDCWALGLVITEVVTGRVVGFRMGRFDLPIFMMPNMLTEAINESRSLGGPMIGGVCAMLLAESVAQRATTNDITVLLGQGQKKPAASCQQLVKAPHDTSSVSSANISTTPRGHRSFTTQGAQGGNAVDSKCNATNSYHGSSVSTMASMNQADSWTSTNGMTSTPTASVPALAERPLWMSTPPAGASPTQATRPAVSLPGPPATAPNLVASTPVTSMTMPRATLPQTHTPTASIVQSKEPAGSVEMRAPSPSSTKLEPGQMVTYKARTNDHHHQAILLGRVPARNAWHIQLTATGALKEVEDVESWRLAASSSTLTPANSVLRFMSNLTVPRTATTGNPQVHTPGATTDFVHAPACGALASVTPSVGGGARSPTASQHWAFSPPHPSSARRAVSPMRTACGIRGFGSASIQIAV